MNADLGWNSQTLLKGEVFLYSSLCFNLYTVQFYANVEIPIHSCPSCGQPDKATDINKPPSE